MFKFRSKRHPLLHIHRLQNLGWSVKSGLLSFVFSVVLFYFLLLLFYFGLTTIAHFLKWQIRVMILAGKRCDGYAAQGYLRRYCTSEFPRDWARGSLRQLQCLNAKKKGKIIQLGEKRSAVLSFVKEAMAIVVQCSQLIPLRLGLSL